MRITGGARIVGVWGFPVKHSLSPVMHNAALEALGLDWAYVPFAVDPVNIESAVSAIRSLGFVGVNITVPLKELVTRHLDLVEPSAAKINSVNTIVNREGILSGYSTDGPGLMWDLTDKSALPSAGGSVLILGAGGSARAIVDLFAKEDYRLSIANRTSQRAERLVDDLGVQARVVDWTRDSLFDAVLDADLIVNSTTLGMSSAESDGESLLSADAFRPGKVLYDLVYSPPETPTMRLARLGGADAYNGLGMLVRQGALSLQMWTGLDIGEMPLRHMEAAVLGK